MPAYSYLNLNSKGDTMNKYMQELASLKTWDEVQAINSYDNDKGYQRITTAGHGYLVVPKTDKNAKLVNKTDYSFNGTLAYYLEEDCEAGEFINAIECPLKGRMAQCSENSCFHN